jgi:hypothetical protein
MLGLLDYFWSPIVRVSPLKTPFRLLMDFITIFIRLFHSYTFVATITYSTLTLLHSLETLRSNLYCTIANKVS